MLQQIRKTANSTPFKIILILLAISFALSVSDKLTGPSSKEIATFSEIEPITYNEFAKTRALKIRQLQQNSNEPISEEQIKDMGINQFIVQNLVTNKLLEFLAYKFDLDFSDKVMADFIRGLPMFRNKSNEFDIDKFKSFLRSQNITEGEYSDEIRNALSKDIIMSSLVGNAYISDIRTNNIISHMSETRKVDVATISLTPPASSAEEFDLKALQNFYKENSDMFKTQETRDICYAKLDSSSAKGQVTITDSDAQSYWNNNKDEFAGQKFDKVKDSIKSKLQKDNIDHWLIETSKALSDEVAGGSTLQEIATKYHLKRICEKSINSDNIETRADGLFTNFIPQISEMSDQEVSHPLDLPNKGDTPSGQILLEIAKLSPEQIKDFDSVKDKVSGAYGAFLYKQDILKKLQDFSASTETSNFTQNASTLGMNITSSRDYTRANLTQNVSFPSEMLVSMFASNVGKVMGPFVTDDNAYVFIVRSIGYDKKTKSNLQKEASDNIVTKLREGMFEELMMYATSLSKMKLNMNFDTE